MRLLLIGPKPPPFHGTSIKFGAFCNFVRQQLGASSVDLIDTQTGDKAITPLFNHSSFTGYARILIQSVFKGWKADVILIFGSQRFATVFGAIATCIFRLMGKRTYLSLFGGNFDLYLEGLPRPIYHVVQLLFSLFRGIIVETHHLERTLANLWPRKLHYVPNFRESPIATNVRHTHDANAMRFLYVGVIRRQKGIGELLQAFGHLTQMAEQGELKTSVWLDLYGPIYNNSRDYVDLCQAGYFSNIRFHGEVPYEQVMRAYSEADVFVFPSYWPSEGHSGAVIEALIHGIPVVAANWRGTSELIRDGKNGLLCPPQDPQALAGCMERLTREARLRQELAEGAKGSASDFNAETVCATMLKIIVN